MMQKMAKTVVVPISLNKNGIKDGIKAAKIQWTEVPKEVPAALSLFGNNSEMNTQITAPCPIACEAINKKKNNGTAIPFHSK